METFDPDDYQPFERTLGFIDDLPSEESPRRCTGGQLSTTFIIRSQSFLDSGLTHLTLVKSPGYAPPTADALVPIIEPYFDLRMKAPTYASWDCFSSAHCLRNRRYSSEWEKTRKAQCLRIIMLYR